MKEKVTELESSNARIELQLKELTEALVKKKNVSYFVEKDVTEVLFLKKEEPIEAMTVDTGCSPNLTGEKWLSQYLERNKMRREDLKRYRNKFRNAFSEDNMVKNKDGGIEMFNRKNNGKTPDPGKL